MRKLNNMTTTTVKTWKTIIIKDKPNKKDINISSYAQEMLDKIEYPVKEQTLDLVKVTVKELFEDEELHTTFEIYAKAKKLGLKLCPPQVGAQLREDYTDQPLNEWIYIGMKQIADRRGDPDVFLLARNEDGLWLRNDLANPDSHWNPDNQFVFSLRKSLKLSKPLKPLKTIDPLSSLTLEKRIKVLEKQMKKWRKAFND